MADQRVMPPTATCSTSRHGHDLAATRAFEGPKQAGQGALRSAQRACRAVVHDRRQKRLEDTHVLCTALRAPNGPKQAGQVARAALGVARLRGVVDVHDAEALGIPVRPLKVVCATARHVSAQAIDARQIRIASKQGSQRHVAGRTPAVLRERVENLFGTPCSYQGRTAELRNLLKL